MSPLFDKDEYKQSFKGILLPKNSLIVLRLPYPFNIIKKCIHIFILLILSVVFNSFDNLK